MLFAMPTLERLFGRFWRVVAHATGHWCNVVWRQHTHLVLLTGDVTGFYDEIVQTSTVTAKSKYDRYWWILWVVWTLKLLHLFKRKQAKQKRKTHNYELSAGFCCISCSTHLQTVILCAQSLSLKKPRFAWLWLVREFTCEITFKRYCLYMFMYVTFFFYIPICLTEKKKMMYTFNFYKHSDCWQA